ncbi:MAG: hypothetical protein C4523_12100 [Myxococcales bacterium]|nr:MAG: hypothetical protein C4523_12100 [Myxococcales bacterium]
MNHLRADLLSIRPFRVLLGSPLFPVALQVLTLAAAVYLGWLGWGAGLDKTPDELMTFRKTHLTTLAVWGLWWPLMIAAALFLGRAWCTVCPMELLNRLGDAVARVLHVPRAKLPKMLRAGWAIFVAYLILQLLVAGLFIHRTPHYTAFMLLTLGLLALATGLVFRAPRSFCKGLCPAAALLSVYGRFTPLQLDKCDPAICSSCKTKDCVHPANRERFDKRSCPSMIRPFDRAPSDGCVLCLQCAKVCPKENIGFGWADPVSSSRTDKGLKPFEAAFVLIAAGFVAHDTIGESDPLERLFHAAPDTLAAAFPAIGFGWWEALWFLGLFPLALWGIILAASYMIGKKAAFRDTLFTVALAAAPVVAVAHLGKALAKLSSWGGFLPLALSDPSGELTLRGFADHSLSKPASMLPFSVIGTGVLALLLAIAWRRGKARKESGTAAVWNLGLAGVAVVFGGVLAAWIVL